MNTPRYVPAHEEGRWTSQPWGEQPVANQPEHDEARIADVESSARAERIKQARQAVQEALDNPTKEQ